jgi:hypothetical protein
MKHIQKHKTKKAYSLSGFKDLIFGNKSPFSHERWGHQVDDICYALENKNRVKLTVVDGRITKVALL